MKCPLSPSHYYLAATPKSRVYADFITPSADTGTVEALTTIAQLVASRHLVAGARYGFFPMSQMPRILSSDRFNPNPKPPLHENAMGAVQSPD